ncbi:MAG: ATP-binding protein [Pseudaminobacter sp.]
MSMSVIGTNRRKDYSWSLSGKFAVAGGVIMLGAAAIAGTVTSEMVAKATVEHTATSTALFMDSFLSPHVQGLSWANILPPEASASLDRLLGSDSFEFRFPHLEIWNPDGLVAYSRTKELVGRTFAPPDGLVAALGGEVASQYTDLKAAEHVARNFSKKYLEIYVPMREYHSGKIIAVAEIHELPEAIEKRLFQVRLQAWLVTGALTLLLMASLFGIVHRGSRTIAGQQEKLHENMRAVQDVSEQNRMLKERSQRASSRLAELNAKYLRNVGAELHDGPAQLVGLAALKVEHVRRARTAAKRDEELGSMETVLAEAIREIRTISKGLMLPEIEDLPLCGVVGLAISAHERRTGTKVAINCDNLGKAFPHAVKICVYRFIQEGLNNAFKHAGGHGQKVSCRMKNTILVLSVEDGGKEDNHNSAGETGLGLAGMRDRVESLGGTLAITSRVNGGTRVEMNLDLSGADRNA